MKVKQDFSKLSVPLSLNRRWRFLDLFRVASSRTRSLTVVAVALAWVQLAVLSAFRGGATLLSFLTDYATKPRFLMPLRIRP